MNKLAMQWTQRLKGFVNGSRLKLCFSIHLYKIVYLHILNDYDLNVKSQDKKRDTELRRANIHFYVNKARVLY